MDRRGGTIDQRKAADQELYAFCLATLKALVAMEASEDNSLQLMCCMHVSIIRTANGTFDYIVNEVERGAYTCLFSWIHMDFLPEKVADEFFPHFMTWIRTRSRTILSRSSVRGNGTSQ